MHLSSRSKPRVQGCKRKATCRFFRVVAWRDLADIIRKHCHRGDRVAVYGSAQTYAREDDNGEKIVMLNIVAGKVEFLGKASDAPPQLERIDRPKLEPIMGKSPFDEV